MSVAIIIPAYNEEKLIASTVYHLSKLGEVIVVADGDDRTAEIARDEGATVLEFCQRLGKGGAIKKGLEFALKNGFELMGFVDADMPVPLEDLKKLVNALGKHDIAIGSRWKGKAVGYSFYRIVGSMIGNITSRTILGLPFSDTQCGAKFFISDVVPVALSVKTNSFSFDVAFLKKALDSGFSIKEIPVRWRHGKRKPKPRLSDGIKLWFDMWRFALASP